jgi:hypothetical protein
MNSTQWSTQALHFQDMDDLARQSPQGGQSSTFDVRSWLAGLGHLTVDKVEYVAESERQGRRTVTYNCGGTTAKVRMSPLPGAAAWELVAEMPGAVDRVLLPGGTRFIWRQMRGTHA